MHHKIQLSRNTKCVSQGKFTHHKYIHLKGKEIPNTLLPHWPQDYILHPLKITHHYFFIDNVNFINREN